MIDKYSRKITYMRLSVTQLCNLRCVYCMPEDGIVKKSHEEMLTEEEMIRAVKVAASLGIRKIRITGGEPLVKKNIISICEKVANVGGIEEVSLTTNGILLEKYASDLRKAGVKRINISLDTINPEKYKKITRCGNLSDVIGGLEKALLVGFEKIKINSVLIGGFNDDEIEDLASLTKKYPIDVRFIELMPMLENSCFSKESYIDSKVVLERLPKLELITSLDRIAKNYRLPNALGSIGLISPISDNFCDKCNRIRLTADGYLKPCLHSSEEIYIKGLDEESMKSKFERCILDKPKSHPDISCGRLSEANRSMNRVGG